MSSYLLLFTIMVSSTQAVNVEFAYNSRRGGPDLYMGDTLTLTCTSTGGSGITAMALSLNAPDQQWVSCIQGDFLSSPWTRSLQPAEGPFFSFSFPDCASGNPSGFTYSISRTIAEDFRTHLGSAFYCFSIENRPVTTNSSKSLVIGDLKVPPENLTLTISPDPVVEGESFTLLCNSSSNSGSVYKYERSRDGGLTWSEITVSPPTYIPTSADRGGLLVRCTDTAHMTWTGGNTVKQTEVLPNYLVTSGILSLNPLVDNYLTCDVSGRSEPIYSWTRSNGSETLESVRTVTLLSDETPRDGEREEVVCTATVIGTSLSSTVKWQIIWSVPRSTVTAAVVVAGVEGAVLIIIAIAILIWWCRKRKGDAKPNPGVQLEPRLPVTIGDHSTPGAESIYTSLVPRHDTEERNYQQLDVAGNCERLYCNIPLSSDRPA